ncbi:MAG: hypothetical protein ACYDDE_00640 [bacterium]
MPTSINNFTKTEIDIYPEGFVEINTIDQNNEESFESSKIDDIAFIKDNIFTDLTNLSGKDTKTNSKTYEKISLKNKRINILMYNNKDVYITLINPKMTDLIIPTTTDNTKIFNGALFIKK